MSLGRARRAPLDRMRGETAHAAAEAKPWVERLARCGFAAKGVVYLVIGFLALQAAMGSGGRTTDTTGALRTLLNQPFGKLLLAVVTVGLFGYALWRLVEATINPGGGDRGAKDIPKRIGYVVSGITYGALGLTAVRLLMGTGTRGGGSKSLTAGLMAQPLGQWLVVGLGLAAIGTGLSFLWKAYKTEFRSEFNLHQMSEGQTRAVILSGRIGYAARGVVFGLIGFFLVMAGLHANPKEARGLEGVLDQLAKQPYGPWLLGLAAVGLMAYGVHMFVAARYRKVWA